MKKPLTILAIALSLTSCQLDTVVCGEVFGKPDPVLNTYSNNYTYFLLLKQSDGLSRWVEVSEAIWYSTNEGEYLCQEIN